MSSWATPIVSVVKSNGNVRICGDFKVTVSQELWINKYPLQRIEEIFTNLSNGQKYSNIDLRPAFFTLEFDDESKNVLSINTHKGLYGYNRLLYGAAQHQWIWQLTIDTILQGIPGIRCILDNMVVTDATDDVHLNNLEQVLSKLSEYGLNSACFPRTDYLLWSWNRQRGIVKIKWRNWGCE